MRKVLLAAALLLVAAAGAGTYALHRWDDGRADRLAEGVRIAGLDVGGKRAEEALALLEREVMEHLRRPLVLVHGERRFTVEPGLVDVEADVEPLVAAALRESRDGNFITRSFRDLTGGEESIDLPLRVEYSREAVGRVVAGIRRALDRPSREAKSSVSFAGVRIEPSQTGLAVRPAALRRAIAARLVRPTEDRAVTVPVRTLRPKTTTRELRERYRYFIAISRSRRELRFFVKNDLVKSYRVGIGAVGFETPAGQYRIETKAANPAWYVPNKPWAGDLAGTVVPGDDPSNPIKARWLGFHDGAGIHGTDDEGSIGGSASHGCIRMLVKDVVDLYERVPLHTPLHIA